MSVIDCFWVEPTGREKRWLRRYAECLDGQACAPNAAAGYSGAYHSASAPVEDGETRFTETDSDGEKFYAAIDPSEYRRDGRWPMLCGCGYIFQRDDPWQVFAIEIYRAADSREWHQRELPPGAMYDAWWIPRKGPDGRSLAVCLPPAGGLDVWLVDMRASSGGYWTRTGEIPRVTVTPSILSSHYHGFLTDGQLREC